MVCPIGTPAASTLPRAYRGCGVYRQRACQPFRCSEIPEGAAVTSPESLRPCGVPDSIAGMATTDTRQLLRQAMHYSIACDDYPCTDTSRPPVGLFHRVRDDYLNWTMGS